MAEKEKKNRIKQVMDHEWKYENLFLIILALFALELGVLLLTGDLTIAENAFIIGEYWKAFAWALVGLGTVSILLVAISFYRPSFDEAKHVTGLKKKEFFSNTVIVLVFCTILALLFVGYDAVIKLVIELF